MSVPVDFYYDYASPWSYLASEIIERALPGVTIVYKPAYLRGFPQFAKGVPLSALEAAYGMKDLHRCTTHWQVPFTFTPHFPLNGVHALRGALWAQAHGGFPAYHQLAYRAAWREGRDIGQKQTVIDVAGEAGLDKAAFAAGLDDQVIKDALRAQTDEVQKRGAFGMPTFFAGDEMYFGHDRMDYLRRALSSPS